MRTDFVAARRKLKTATLLVASQFDHCFAAVCSPFARRCQSRDDRGGPQQSRIV